MAKKSNDSQAGRGVAKLADGHYTLDGAVWHTPKAGSPTECEIPGCDKVLGAWRDHDPFAAFDDDDDDDDD